MTPQTALAEESGAITPVIVKSGGDPHVSITSDSIRFAENVAGPTWSSSQSMKNGRITKLKIKVGLDTTELPVTPTSQLASVTFDFGAAQLIAMESGSADNVFLLLVSPEVQFSAIPDDGVVPDGDWTFSKTSVPNRIKSVKVMVGDQQLLSSDFQTDDVTVEIYFNQS
jgi:hypothetical protein